LEFLAAKHHADAVRSELRFEQMQLTQEFQETLGATEDEFLDWQTLTLRKKPRPRPQE
jgi:hypothetical protein